MGIEEDKKEITMGKRLGLIAFVVSEALVVLVTVAIGAIILMENRIDSGLISSLLLFQTTIIGITWGTKATSNFAKLRQEVNDEAS